MVDFLTKHPKFVNFNAKELRYRFKDQYALRLSNAMFRYFVWETPIERMEEADVWFQELYIESQKRLWEADKIKNMLCRNDLTDEMSVLNLTSLLVSLEYGCPKEHELLHFNPDMSSNNHEYLAKVNEYLKEYFDVGLKDFEGKWGIDEP